MNTRGTKTPPSSPSPRVVHVIAPGPMGGAERVVLDSAAARMAAGRPTGVLTLLDPAGSPPPLVGALTESNVDVLVCRARARDYRAEIRAIRQAVIERRADVVHCHGYRPNVLAVLALRSRPCGLVSTAHGYTGGGLKNRVFEWLDTRALRRFDAVITVSRVLEEYLIRSGVPSDVVRRIPNAMRPLPLEDRSAARRRLDLPSSVPVAGWIGRLSPEKGPDVFIDAMTRLAERDVHAVVIGDGAERTALETAARAHGLANRVRLTGTVPEAGRLLAAFDVVVLSSRTEGLPIVLLEAMDARIPIVATEVGEISTVTMDGSLALVVQPNDPAALARAIDDTLRNRDAARQRAERAQRHARNEYSMDRWTARLETVYESVAKSR